MTRSELERRNEERTTFTGTFERFGTKSGWMGTADKTVLLKDIRRRGAYVCDHLWFNFTKAFARLNLQPGDVVQFDARVKEYVKGYFGNDYSKAIDHLPALDYKLSFPTRVVKLPPDYVP
jgi:hypothetical protein